MRVVGVSRVLDEADIIEPFIRHHAALLDLHIVLDNGSSDGTVEILRALHGEGIALQVYQTQSPIFLEQAYNTGLYRLALGEGADWVMFLDTDELLTMRAAPRPHDLLRLVPDGLPCLRVSAFRYARPAPEPGQHPFTALRRRGRDQEMPKIVVRRLEPVRVSIYAGNHFAFIDGREDNGLPQDRMLLAHVPDRSPLQVARRIIQGRIKPIASGAAAAAHFSTHRVADFEALKTDARAWLDRLETVEPPGAILDPAPYLGGPLRYTASPDELARLLSRLAVDLETLARSHGDILDSKRLIKREMQRKGSQIRRLF